MSFVDGKSILITGGTGSFGKAFVRHVLDHTQVKRVVVFSRDELKQSEMQESFAGESRLRFFIGDVRDYGRLFRAFDGVDLVVHAAALKQVPAIEYNPIEAVRTNIHGAENVINAALDRNVPRVIALSTDKACSPINLYGATKLASDKLIIAANAYTAGSASRFSAVRYGNVVGSRGSVVPFFKRIAASGEIPITDPRMTRFWITLQQGVEFVLASADRMRGGELFVPKIPSMRVVDLANVMAPGAKLKNVGIRPGEKIHEEMISVNDARVSVDLGSYYVIKPQAPWWDARDDIGGTTLPDGFSYSSDNNTHWLGEDDLRKMIADV